MGVFFVSWELWQQMTFVSVLAVSLLSLFPSSLRNRRPTKEPNTNQCLASAIALVFFIGYMKLCWTNRYLKRQEALDDEKRIRLNQMRKSGLSSRKDMDVPFGIRAIESGVTVEGIWICNPSIPFRTGNPDAKVQPPTVHSNAAIGHGDGREEASQKGTTDDRLHERHVSGGGTWIAENRHSSDQAYQSARVSAQSQAHTPRTYRPPHPQRIGHIRSNSWQESQAHVPEASPAGSRDAPGMHSSSRPRTSFSGGVTKLHKSP